MPIDRHWNQPGTCPDEGSAHTQVTGLFNPGRVAGIENNPSEDIERGLGRGNDEYLMRPGVHTPGVCQVFNQYFP
jgi:hypothetical protein